MYTLLISLIVGAAAGYFSYWRWDWGWGIGCGVFCFMLSQLVIGLLLRRRIMALQQRIQEIMADAQNRINRQINLFQLRPPASMNSARKQLEELQAAAARKALAATDDFKVFYRWNFMLERQINVMRVQLLFQLKEYKKVDALLPKTLVRDPQTAAIQLVRLYRTEAPIDDFYRSKQRLFKSDDLAFFASVYAWMKLKQEDEAAARAALTEAKKKTDNAVMLENLDRLLNGKAKHYTMSGFGDLWYALGLEEPRVKAQRRRPY